MVSTFGRCGAQRPPIARICVILSLAACIAVPPLLPSVASGWQAPSPLSASADSALRSGLESYYQLQLKDALPLLRAAVEGGAADSEACCWLAETLRRLGRRGEAVAEARRALARRPCDAFAHTVIADATNPMFSDWDSANSDTSWSHLILALSCDSTDGNAWSSVWSQAIRRGDAVRAHQAERAMIATGFLPSPLLAYTRWAMRDLPPGAALLTNGDMDTYPAVALQQVEGYRADVAVVNVSLLNTPWYARWVRDRLGVTMPYRDAQLDSLAPYRLPDGSVALVSSQIVGRWIAMVRTGGFARPLTAAVSVQLHGIGGGAQDRFQLEGAFWECRGDSGFAPTDTARAFRSLRGVLPAELRGRYSGDRDRSPVRHMHSAGLAKNIVELGLMRGNAWLDAGRVDEARASAPWLDELAGISPGEHLSAGLQKFHARLAEAGGKDR